MENKIQIQIISKVDEITIKECEKRIPIIVEDYKELLQPNIEDNEANSIAISQDEE